MTPGIPRSTFTGSGGATTRTSRRPIRGRCCTGRARGRRPSWRIWATCCWTIDKGSSPTSVRPTRRGLPARRRRCCWRPAHLRAARSGRTRATMWRASWPTHPGRHAPRGAKGPLERDRWPDHAACGLSHQSAETETRGTGLWMDEDRRGLAQAPHRGVALVDWQLTFAAAAYNLVRLRKLEATCP